MLLTAQNVYNAAAVHNYGVCPVHKELPMTISAYRNGPYLLRGEFRIFDEDGNEVPRPSRTVALCRCGKSMLRPFCDGTHRAIGFSPSGECGRASILGMGDEPK